VDWTPKTTLLGLRVQFWKLSCNRAHGFKVQRQYLARIQKKKYYRTHQFLIVHRALLINIRRRLQSGGSIAGRKQRRQERHFWRRRQQQLQRRKTQIWEKIVKQLRLREDQKRSATQNKAVQKKLRSGGVSRVTFFDKNGIVHESTGSEHLEDLCNNANEAKLQQTAETPFMAGAL
jgi:homoserine acetyltransferase